MAFQEYNISRSVEDGDQLGSVMYFLGVFAGHWLPGNERSQFSCCYDFRPGGMTRYYLQVHFRSSCNLEKTDNTLKSLLRGKDHPTFGPVRLICLIAET